MHDASFLEFQARVVIIRKPLHLDSNKPNSGPFSEQLAA
jgi:hypothetical protein